ncbi:DUF3883 domain-containing protein [Alcaligenes faecalis]|uniref:DUF3883 domain-containing protein n=1 Tax=Alcaligenes faecalis TaxID=511 RepID=UPI001EF16080|nr:DUF3883 domain-containing protein [Alcaligenes faecalis]ULH06461.1 DUF3883 domain-containing protein [Alcaligenes faecalis]
MRASSTLNSEDLQKWEKNYQSSYEQKALNLRGDFLKSFPLNDLPRMKLDDYVIGLKRPTFCTFVEVITRPWANIQGASATKFGIYFGKTKSNPEKKYRFTRKFGENQTIAFKAVKEAILELVELGSSTSLNFAAIDANPLSQMFKAKILSLYFPRKFLNVCSREHLELLGEELGYGNDRLISEYQHLLVKAKRANTITKDWTNPKFMSYLYDSYIYGEPAQRNSFAKPSKKIPRRINFEETADQRDKIGKAAEAFALQWEQDRLIGADLEGMVSKIQDRRDRPGYGYDFLSHSSKHQERYIEVKSVGKLPRGGGHRFFLSDNEHQVSLSNEHCSEYYFYLVFFNKNGQPIELQPIRADELYRKAELLPVTYMVRFEYQT